MQETILVVGDEEDQELQDSKKLLEVLLPDCCVHSVSLGECVAAVKSDKMDCLTIIMNIRKFKHRQGVEVISMLQRLDSQLPVIVWVHYGEESFARDAVGAGAYDFLVKPVASEKVSLSLQHACDARRMRRYVMRLEQHIARQTDISPHERQAIMMNQMYHLLVDQNGKIKPLKSIEKEVIVAALRYTDGCVSRAARSLGIGRSTLYRKVGEYGIYGYMRRDTQTTRPMMEVSSNTRISSE